MSELNELDALVRENLLRYPMHFETRWDVLRHLYLVAGNNYEWINGRLVDVLSPPESEGLWRAEFFRDLDAIEEELKYAKVRPEFTRMQALRRARRQFQLDHLDLIVHEDLIPIRVLEILEGGLRSLAFTAPDDAEESFRRGAEGTLRAALPELNLAAARGAGIELRDATIRQIKNLR